MSGKKPKKKLSENKLRAQAEQLMETFVEESAARYKRAYASFEMQDDETQEAIERMTSLLIRIARRRMWFGVGLRDDRVVLDIPTEAITANAFYMANEIIKDLAIMDIRVAAFKFQQAVCAECGTEINPIRKKKVKRG